MPNGRDKVLVLEDDFLIAMDLGSLVEDCGYAVVGPAPSCDDALCLLKHTRVTAALLDVKLGKERCDAVADALNAQGVPWAFVTGCDAQRLPARFATAPIVMKPFDPVKVAVLLRLLTEGMPS